MNRDDLINFAEKAGFVVDEISRQHQPNCIFHTRHMVDELLAVFSDLIAAHEREQCAKLALAADDQGSVNQLLMKKRIAKAIKARSIK